MGLLDIAVIATLGLMVGWPWLASLIPTLTPRPAATAAKQEAGSSDDDWRQAWASTLIRLINEIEAGEGRFEDDRQALILSRELLWEVIGGDGAKPSKAK
jgi:hypothetical protein